MNHKRNAAHSDRSRERARVLLEIAKDDTVGEVIGVRAAKAHFSALLDIVATGREIVVTRGGMPKVRLVGYDLKPKRKLFGGAENHLASMPGWKGGPTAEQLIRADRDGRE